ncbi:MAG: porin family protein [Prevotellaceae bacterium]|nr:porin family protein [Prevotellaceae bacterium]
MVAFAASACLCQAQFFVGGQLGFDYSKSETKHSSVTTDGPKTTTFEIEPTVGYAFSDKAAIGMNLGFDYSKLTGTYNDKDIETKTPEWKVEPYFRYTVVKWDKIRLYAEAGLTFAGSKAKIKAGGVETDGDKKFGFGIGVCPEIAYFVTDHISINADLNLLTAGFFMSKITEPDDDETTYKSFGLGVNEPTDFTIGFQYTF